MSTLGDVFEVLNRTAAEGVFDNRALGGAMAALFYAEPVRTYDVGVFVMGPRPQDQGGLVSLEPVCLWLRRPGLALEESP